MRTGSDYLRSLNDGRQVFVDGERVDDVTRHIAFREAARLGRIPVEVVAEGAGDSEAWTEAMLTTAERLTSARGS